jgi:tetratricopeptide (TPR) repeat protein
MKNLKFAIALFLSGLYLFACENADKGVLSEVGQLNTLDITIQSSDSALVEVFNWAKEKARFYVQTDKLGRVNVWENGSGTDTVQYIPSYWAGYPGRSAFYSRDFCHQLVGAHLLGLEEENFTMLKAFAASADENKKWFPLWAINFDGSPFLLDYRGDDDFVREVPAAFELLEKAYQLYLWTGNEAYLKDEVLWNFYTKIVRDFIELHDSQIPNGVAEGTGKGIFAGAASYNEQRDAPLIESGDGIATQYKAFTAFASMAAQRKDLDLAKEYQQKATDLKTYFNEEWAIKNTLSYIRGYIAKGTPIGGWGKENSWFMPMKGITEAGSKRTLFYLDFIQEKLESKEDIPDNVEALSYLPEMFFSHHQNERGWYWMQHIMNNLKQDHAYQKATGRNGDYPEVSYVLLQNIVQDLLGLVPNAAENRVTTFSHLPKAVAELGIQRIKIGRSIISVQHQAQHTTSVHYQSGQGVLTWQAQFPGVHTAVEVNGEKQAAQLVEQAGIQYTSCTIRLKPGDAFTVSTIL